MNNRLRRWGAASGELQDLARLQWLFLDNNLLEDGAWPLDQLADLRSLEWLCVYSSLERRSYGELMDWTVA